MTAARVLVLASAVGENGRCRTANISRCCSAMLWSCERCGPDVTVGAFVNGL